MEEVGRDKEALSCGATGYCCVVVGDVATSTGAVAMEDEVEVGALFGRLPPSKINVVITGDNVMGGSVGRFVG